MDLERSISFLKHPQYMEKKLKELNPGTSTDLDVTTTHTYMNHVLYVLGLLLSPSYPFPPLIFIDACHRVFLDQGRIFIADVQDVNQQNIPLAIRVYDGETIDNGCRFIKVSLSVKHGPSFIHQ